MGNTDHTHCGKTLSAQGKTEHHGRKINNLRCLQEPLVTCDKLNKHSGRRHVSQPPSFPLPCLRLTNRRTPKADSRTQSTPVPRRISQINTPINGCGARQQGRRRFACFVVVLTLTQRVVQKCWFQWRT